MEKYYNILSGITYPAILLRKAVEFVLSLMLNIPPVVPAEELPYNESRGHTLHGDFMSPIRSAFFNITVFVVQLLGAVGFFGSACFGLIYLKIGMFDLQTGAIQPMFFVYILFLYLGICFIANLFPSPMSVENFWALAITEGGIISKIIFIVPCLILRAGTFLENLGVTAILATVAPVILYFVI